MESPPIYNPLDKAKNEIRILQLLPGAFDDDVCCVLSVESTQTRFEALSYVWGDTKDLLVTKIQGHRMKVTKNLERALRHIRSQSETRRLWVDAACINQKDDDERGHQVRIMGAIYGGADRVIVWLGPEEKSEECLRAIQRFRADPDLHWDPRHYPDTDNATTPSAIELLFWLRNDWHTRIWTLQEAVLAKSLIYVCGSFVFHKGEVDGLVESFSRHFMHEQCCDMMNIEGKFGLANMELELSHSLNRVRNTIDFRKRDGPSNLLEIVSKFRHRLATNPRDKIFRVLGLTNDLPKGIIDYKQSVVDTYSLAAFELIAETGNLDVLSYILPKSNNDRARVDANDLPSWVPDWSDHRPYEYWRLVGLSRRQLSTNFFNACHLASRPSPKRPSPTSLRWEGFFCDEIIELGPAMHVKGKAYSPEVLQNWRTVVNVDNHPERPYISGCTILDAYWRTLCLNIDPIKGSFESPDKADANTRAFHDDWWWELLRHVKYRDVPGPPSKHFTPIFQQFTTHVAFLSSGRKLFISKGGYLGLAPEDASKGDQVWVLCGGRLPLILRSLKKESGNSSRFEYTFVGDSYVHGIMDGEFVEREMQKGTTPTPVILVWHEY
ncbi:hypothetical protein ACHAPT_010899 [Fusarium lateritium]